MRLGIDVGGTNTDAVLLDGKTVLSWAKSPTTANVTDGIIDVIDIVLKKANVARSVIECVMIGTTHFTNALVERRGLLQVGVIRLGSPASEALPPLSGWPLDIGPYIGDMFFLLPGGYEYDGRVLTHFDEVAVRRSIQKMKGAGIKTAAVSCTFALVNPAMEERTVAIFKEEAPDIAVTMSSSFGRPGFLERENAAIMNASLADMAQRVVNAFKYALDKLNITAPFFISQNDGTLISADYAARYPVLTFGSGPTNSMRGGAFLTGLQDAIVIDIGGTTTDIGALTQGFPRESSLSADIGGVRTNFRMPDIQAIGLGGGTRIHLSHDAYILDHLKPGSFTIGPDSVGYRLHLDSYLFGGKVLTASDIAVAGGLANFGKMSRLPKMHPAVVQGLLNEFKKIMEDGLDRMKMSRDKVSVILVGGGSVLAGKELAGAKEVITPEHASVANAVGAAIAQVGGEAESIVSYDAISRADAMQSLKQKAIQKVIQAGADPTSVNIIDIDEVFLSYMPGNTVQLRAKAVGDLALSSSTKRKARK